MNIDLNTVINVLILGLSAWTLRTVHEVVKIQAGAMEKEKAQDVRIDENRARIIEAEDKITDLQMDMVEIGRHR